MCQPIGFCVRDVVRLAVHRRGRCRAGPSFHSRSHASTSGCSTRMRQKVTNAPSFGRSFPFMPAIHCLEREIALLRALRVDPFLLRGGRGSAGRNSRPSTASARRRGWRRGRCSAGPAARCRTSDRRRRRSAGSPRSVRARSSACSGCDSRRGPAAGRGRRLRRPCRGRATSLRKTSSNQQITFIPRLCARGSTSAMTS